MTLALTDKFQLKALGVQPGMALPLHSHPHMYGVMKPIFGNGTLLSLTPKFSLQELPRKYVIGQKLRATKSPPKHVSANRNKEPLYFCPIVHNLQQVKAKAESSFGFVDILVPPYDAIKRIQGFFRIVCEEEGKENEVMVEVIEKPNYDVIIKDMVLFNREN